MIRKKLLFLMALAFFIMGCAASNTPDTRSAMKTDHGTAPDFTLPDQNGEMVTLSTVLEKYNGAVLAFYPKDDSKN